MTQTERPMNMNRLNFIAGGLGAGMVALVASLPSGARQPQIGYLNIYTHPQPKRITIDGRELDMVFELDDVEGWVRRYVFPIKGNSMTIERLTGTVEVFW